MLGQASREPPRWRRVEQEETRLLQTVRKDLHWCVHYTGNGRCVSLDLSGGRNVHLDRAMLLPTPSDELREERSTSPTIPTSLVVNLGWIPIASSYAADCSLHTFSSCPFSLDYRLQYLSTAFKWHSFDRPTFSVRHDMNNELPIWE